jgi:hypothetical protein
LHNIEEAQREDGLQAKEGEREGLREGGREKDTCGSQGNQAIVAEVVPIEDDEGTLKILDQALVLLPAGREL